MYQTNDVRIAETSGGVCSAPCSLCFLEAKWLRARLQSPPSLPSLQTRCSDERGFLYRYVAVDPLNRAFGFVASPELVGGLSARGLDLYFEIDVSQTCELYANRQGPSSFQTYRFIGIAVLLQAEIGSEAVSFETESTYEPLGSPLLRLLAPKGRSRASASTPSSARLSYC